MLQAYAGGLLPWLSAHPLALFALWGALSAAGTWLGRRARTPAERDAFKASFPWLFGAMALLEGFGVDLPKVLGALAWLLRQLLPGPRPPGGEPPPGP